MTRHRTETCWEYNGGTARLTGFDHIGIATLEKKGTIGTRAFTGDLALSLDKVQYAVREGPCSAALATVEPPLHQRGSRRPPRDRTSGPWAGLR